MWSWCDAAQKVDKNMVFHGGLFLNTLNLESVPIPLTVMRYRNTFVFERIYCGRKNCALLISAQAAVKE